MDVIHNLQDVLYDDIPLTKAMGITPVSFTDGKLVFKTPLAPNANHKSTFFGGSLYTVAVTTGWSLLYLHQQALKLGGHVVINEGSIKYQQPVLHDVYSYCSVSAEQLDRLERQMTRRGKAVMNLDVVLGHEIDEQRVVFSGRYAIV